MINHNILNAVDSLSTMYQLAIPYPFIVLDNFLNAEVLDRCVEEINKNKIWYGDTNPENNTEHQINKFYTPNSNLESIQTLKNDCPITMLTLEYLYSKEMLDFLSRLTQIKDLVNDPFFIGGGIHKSTNGGKLSVHADFNLHFYNNTHRRLNLLLYLNKNWKDEYKGELELWDSNLTSCAVKIKPIFNRVVIFNITDYNYHGFPTPINVPDDVSRLSLATYYYTHDRPEKEKSPFHYVMWKDTK